MTSSRQKWCNLWPPQRMQRRLAQASQFVSLATNIIFFKLNHSKGCHGDSNFIFSMGVISLCTQIPTVIIRSVGAPYWELVTPPNFIVQLHVWLGHSTNTSEVLLTSRGRSGSAFIAHMPSSPNQKFAHSSPWSTHKATQRLWKASPYGHECFHRVWGHRSAGVNW